MTYRRKNKNKYCAGVLREEQQAAGFRECKAAEVCSVRLTNCIGGVEVSQKTLILFDKEKIEVAGMMLMEDE